MRYLVTWSIDIDEAESAEDAALQALDIQRNPESIATVFEVAPNDHGQLSPAVTIDLTPEA